MAPVNLGIIDVERRPFCTVDHRGISPEPKHREKERWEREWKVEGIGGLERPCTDSRGDIERRDCNKSNTLGGTHLGRERPVGEGEKEPGQKRARSVVTLDDNLSGRSGSLQDLSTKISVLSAR